MAQYPEKTLRSEVLESDLSAASRRVTADRLKQRRGGVCPRPKGNKPMNPKQLALMTLDCLDEHRKTLRSMIERDAPIEAIIKQTHAMGDMLATSTQVYIAERQGWGGKTS